MGNNKTEEIKCTTCNKYQCTCGSKYVNMTTSQIVTHIECILLKQTNVEKRYISKELDERGII